MPKIKEVQEVVAALDSMSADDPEAAHSAADELLLASVHPKVAAAYKRLVERCGWWAAS